MEIIISDERIVERLHKLADQLNQTPEQIVAEAIEKFEPAPQQNDKTFWKSIRGIGDSGDPNLAYRIKEILSEEIDLEEGWSKPHAPKDADRQ